MTEKTHDDFLSIDKMIEGLFSKNEDIYEKLVNLDFSEENEMLFGNIIVAGTILGVQIASNEYMVDHVFNIKKNHCDIFIVENANDPDMIWNGTHASCHFTLDVIEDFTIMMDNLRFAMEME